MLSMLSAAAIASAGTDRLVPEQYPSIQHAIAASAHGDRVLVGPGTWSGTVDTRNLAITVESTAGLGATVLDAGASGSVFKIYRGETSSTVIRGFTITGGTGTLVNATMYGGGIYIKDSSPTFEDCHIVANVAQMGAGAHIEAGSPTFTNCTFHDNFATVDGGAARLTAFSYPTFTDCTFTQNGASVYGGAINYAFDSLGMHDGCTFDGNTAGVNGGALSMTCDCSAANVANTALCNSQPSHVEGPWNNLGGNTVCEICTADITVDGVVDVDDVLAIVSAWGGCVCVEDITNDSAVSTDDLLVVLEHWGVCG